MVRLQMFLFSAIKSYRAGCALLLIWALCCCQSAQKMYVTAIERLSREIGRRTRVGGTFPDGRFVLMLVTVRLKYVAESEWGFLH